MDAQGCFGSRPVWLDSGLKTERRWLTMLWDRIAIGLPVGKQRSLISEGQSLALWRQIIDASASGEFILDRLGIARACADARRALLDHELLPADQGGPEWAGDPEMLLEWARRFDAVLTERRWVDPDSLHYRIGRMPFVPDRGIRLLDVDTLLPAMQRLQRRWRASGLAFETLAPPRTVASSEALVTRDADAELRLVAEWAATTQERSPQGRIAIVAPDLENRHLQLMQQVAELIGSDRVWCARGQPISEVGPFGAALSVLCLLSPQGGFPTMSRWLRSPFFTPCQNLAKAMELETRLRRDSRSDDSFVDAYLKHGLRRDMHELLPDEVSKLDAALDRIPKRATPTAWAGIWQSCLRDLDWSASDTARAEASVAWDTAMAAFAELSPILGQIDAATALAEFEAIAKAQTVFRAPVVHGVHLLRHISDVGPGYEGVWVTGFSDQSWPEPPQTQPLVPWTVRAAHSMPGARPEQTLAMGRRLLERLLTRTQVVRFSCPARRADEPLTPCPQAGPWHAVARTTRSGPGGFAASRIGSRALSQEVDPAPSHQKRRIRGGARTLDLQATCPVRAFCESRLGAAPLEPAEQGLAPRLRGLLVHRCLELLLEPAEPEPPSRRIDQSIETAFLELTRAGRSLWNVQLEMERERVRRLIDGLLALETEREPYLTIDLERRIEVEIAGRKLQCRIDRIDRLPDGAQLLIDYKTGKRLRTGWFEDRLSDSQLPLYAQQFPGTIGAIVMIQLTDSKIEYRAAGISADSVPGRQTLFDDHAAWSAQLARWSTQLTELVEEYIAGDVRLRVADASAADGTYAPLTRVKALLT